MAEVCSGICERCKKNFISTTFSKSLPGNFRYGNGQKWCTLCASFSLPIKLFVFAVKLYYGQNLEQKIGHKIAF